MSYSQFSIISHPIGDRGSVHVGVAVHVAGEDTIHVRMAGPDVAFRAHALFGTSPPPGNVLVESMSSLATRMREFRQDSTNLSDNPLVSFHYREGATLCVTIPRWVDVGEDPVGTLNKLFAEFVTDRWPGGEAEVDVALRRYCAVLRAEGMEQEARRLTQWSGEHLHSELRLSATCLQLRVHGIQYPAPPGASSMTAETRREEIARAERLSLAAMGADWIRAALTAQSAGEVADARRLAAAALRFLGLEGTT